jgi:HSP20 family protein
MSLIRWDPFRELEDVSARLNRFFNQQPARLTVGGDDALSADWAPAVDVQETDAEYLVKADLPEVKKEDVTVEIVDGTLSLRGERHKEKEEQGKRFHRIEREYGRFERRLAVPSGVDAQKVAAEFKDGVLRVHLPKSASAKPKSIDVKVA